ncbi:MAG: hypothetical protein GZ087_09995 [Flavobacterium sp.]|nr:hypothetical protein [Flavobacterium sp.]
MKLPATTKSIILNSICYLYVLLFVYAAVSKVLDFDNFQVQLGQSPLLSAFAGLTSWGIPAIELFISIFLVIPCFRSVALYAAYSLMVLFTAYIFIVLNYSSFVPCSCGGILEKLGWSEHLVFNIFFIIIAVIALFISSGYNTVERKSRRYFIPTTLLTLSIICIGFMTLLFITSEDIVHHRNNFVRRFPPVSVRKAYQADLKYNSYYFAGEGDGKIYLGNNTAPAQVVALDTALQNKKTHYIFIDDNKIKFNAVQVRVFPPNFYVLDGTVPCIFKGKIVDWKATLQIQGTPHFSIAELVDSNVVAFRKISNQNGENILGTISFDGKTVVKYHSELLQKQIDGVFDTDGTMQYSRELKKFVYLYYYRNQFIVTDNRLKLSYRGKTIDTTSKARLKIAWVKKRKEKKLSAPPFIVNRTSCVHNNLLFVNSGLPGRYESLEMWKQASIIDVYSIESQYYLMSFYIYNIEGKGMSSFIVTDTHLFALIGNAIVSYSLEKEIKEEMKVHNNLK